MAYIPHDLLVIIGNHIKKNMVLYEYILALYDNKRVINQILYNYNAGYNCMSKVAWGGDIMKTMICKGDIEMIKLLINNGTDFEPDLDSALYDACYAGNLEIVKYLIKESADIHADNDDALCIAGLKNRIKVVKYLIKKGAYLHDKDSYELLHFIRKRGFKYYYVAE